MVTIDGVNNIYNDVESITTKIDNKKLSHKLLKLLGEEISSSLKILISILVMILS